MINLKLLEIIKESLPNFNGENSSDLIKAEKILKAQQKMYSEFSLNDIENFITFFKENGNKFNILFEDENLLNIFKNEDFKINSSHNSIFPNIMQITSEFRTFCEEPMKRYIQINIQNNHWENLRIFYKNYFPVISPLTKEFLIENLTQKNNLIITNLDRYENYVYFENQYKFVRDEHFFALQSDVDSQKFYPEIAEIVNNLVKNSKVEDYHIKAFIMKTFIVIAKFDSHLMEFRQLLRNNASVAKAWFFSTPSPRKKFRISLQKYFRKDYGEKKEKIILSVFYSLVVIIIILLIYYKIWIAVINELVAYIIFSKRLDRNIIDVPENFKDYSLRKKAKKIALKITLLQIYMLVVFAVLGIGAAILGIFSVTGGAGSIPIIIIGFFVYRAFKR